MRDLEVVELCAGAGGQSLGLELAGFQHVLAVEIDQQAAETLATNLARRQGISVDEVKETVVQTGDVASPDVWRPKDFQQGPILAAGVPCPPFSIAGKQQGATDERDLFAWAVEAAGEMDAPGLLLENVRGLSTERFSAYRHYIADRLEALGYWFEWRLLHAADFGVPQLRPRTILVALKPEFAPYFRWPVPDRTTETVGSTLFADMAADGWRDAEKWADMANDIAPTIVGGSKRHGGADLGPTRAKRAWRDLGVDGLGIADAPPNRRSPRLSKQLPRLTCDMVAKLQGWLDEEDYRWEFTGRKTSQYRQIGNAFPPPVARAVGNSLAAALRKDARSVMLTEMESLAREQGDVIDLSVKKNADNFGPGYGYGFGEVPHRDHVYRVLAVANEYLTIQQIIHLADEPMDPAAVERKLNALARDFELLTMTVDEGDLAYQLGEFKAFTGQDKHPRHELFEAARSQIS